MRQTSPLVCFDLGNVLIELGPSIFCQVRADCRLRLTSLLKYYSLGQVSTSLFFQLLQSFMIRPYSIHDLQDVFIRTRIVGLQEGTGALVADLLANGLELAVLSNINEAHWSHLRRLEMLMGVKHSFLSFQLGVRKPSKEIYELVEFETMRSGRDIVFFDDREENVSTARRCDWDAYQVSPDDATACMRNILTRRGLL